MLTAQETADIVTSAFPSAVLEAVVEAEHPYLLLAPQAWHDVARFLRDDPRLRMNMLRCLSAVDLYPEPTIELVYDLISMRPPTEEGVAAGALWQCGGMISVKLRVPRDGGHVPSVADLWPTANWHEREAYDLFGVTFAGHPDLRRILCPDDWVGHPLRRDYEFPKEYEGIPCMVDTDALAQAARAPADPGDPPAP